jgi:uncharacterized repeat protein (TIGR03803 family)
MMRASDGRPYGTAIGGGAFGRGVVFRLDSANGSRSAKLTVVHSFAGAPLDGEEPIGPLAQSRIDHKLYGTTTAGGPNLCGASNGYCGVVYRLSP